MRKYITTNKLHYKKYLYKARISAETASAFSSFRNRGADRLSEVRRLVRELDEQHKNKEPYAIMVRWRLKEITHTLYQDTKKILESLDKSNDFHIRVENAYHLYVYTSDLNLIDNLANLSHTREIHKPEKGMENFLLLNYDTAIVKAPPENEFRIYLKSQIIDTGLGNWLEANTDKSLVGKQTLRNIKSRYYVNNAYFYVKNDKILTMVRMLIGHQIRRVEKLVYEGDVDKYIHDDSIK